MPMFSLLILCTVLLLLGCSDSKKDAALRAGRMVATDLLASVGKDVGPYLEIFAAGKTAQPDFFPSLGNFSRP